MNSSKKSNLRKPKIISDFDDRDAITDFLSKNEGKRVVVVQGLGFVGAVMALVCANGVSEEYAVIGVDLPDEKNFLKIKSINDGVFPLNADDPKIYEFYNKSLRRGNLLATYDPLAYGFADVIVVDVNLDVEKLSSSTGNLKNYDVDLANFKKAISCIGTHCHENVLVLVETTVPPGTCEKIVKPILDKELSERGLKVDRYKLGHSYERVMPGPEYINSIREFPRVYSGINDSSADATEAFLKTIINTEICALTRLENTTATEMAKVLENSYRATNIAFAVEWSRYAEEAGVDLYDIINAIRVRKTHANLMYPGIGVGGYCLTKDPLLASWSRKEFFGSDSDLNMSINSVSVNDQMPLFAFNRLVQVFGSLKGKRVIILGVSYRGDVGDTRFSPVEVFVDLIKQEGASLRFHDPYVSDWEEQKCEVESDLSLVLGSNPEIIVFSAGHSLYKKDETIEALLNLSEVKIFDAIGILNKEQILTLGSKHKVSVLGCGNENLNFCNK